MNLLTNAFFLMDTHGVPLAVQLGIARTRGVALSIPHYYRDALAAGWAPDTARARVKEAMLDSGELEAYVEAAIEWLKGHRELPVFDGG